MPKLNGFEVCKCIKGDDATKDIPVIMLTASAREKDLQKALREGAYSCITKPFDAQVLLKEIKKAIKGE